MNPGGSGRILKPEFKQMLNKLMFYMEDTEFEKLWKKYDSLFIQLNNFFIKLHCNHSNGKVNMMNINETADNVRIVFVNIC